MTHDCESSVALVKCDCLESLLHFYLGQTQVTVEILAHHFQERQSIQRKPEMLMSNSNWKYGFIFTYPDFLFSPSVFLSTSVYENPYCLSSIHFWMASLISKIWMDVLLLVQAIICKLGWNTMSWMTALPEPLLSVCKVSPPSALKILITVPRYDADAINVPSGFTLNAPSSVSWAWMTLVMLFSATR